MKITLVQFAREREEKEENIERMLDQLREVRNTDLVCLPENWFGVKPLSEEKFEKLLSEFRSIVTEGDFNLITGAGYMSRGESIFDSSYVMDREGNILGHSDKIFPSESVGETDFLSDGKSSPVFEVDGVKLGVVVCVDAVYPEVSRNLAKKGANIIFNPSNIPDNRLEMWKSIGVTRAVENGLFFVFLNNTSTYYPDGRQVIGHSFIASPDGDLILELDDSEQIIDFEIDLESLEDIKSKWGFLERVTRRDSF